MSEPDAVPLPREGEVFFDVRGDARCMRLSWYAQSQIAVFSIWQGNRCTGTFRLPFADLARMVETLQSGPRPRADAADGPRRYAGRAVTATGSYPGPQSAYAAAPVHSGAGSRPNGPAGAWAGQSTQAMEGADMPWAAQRGPGEYGSAQHGQGQHGQGQHGQGQFEQGQQTEGQFGPDQFGPDQFGPGQPAGSPPAWDTAFGQPVARRAAADGAYGGDVGYGQPAARRAAADGAYGGDVGYGQEDAPYAAGRAAVPEAGYGVEYVTRPGSADAAPPVADEPPGWRPAVGHGAPGHDKASGPDRSGYERSGYDPPGYDGSGRNTGPYGARGYEVPGHVAARPDAARHDAPGRDTWGDRDAAGRDAWDDRDAAPAAAGHAVGADAPWRDVGPARARHAAGPATTRHDDLGRDGTGRSAGYQSGWPGRAAVTAPQAAPALDVPGGNEPDTGRLSFPSEPARRDRPATDWSAATASYPVP